MTLTPEALYMQLGQLITEMPNFVESPEASPEKHLWLGRAVAIVETMGDVVDVADLKRAAKFTRWNDEATRRAYANVIAEIMHRALARAELKAPAASQGAFVLAGNVLEAFAMVGKLLGEAKADVLIVDPYANDKLLTDFAVTALENVAVRLLTTDQYKASLQPATERWQQQYPKNRPLEVRILAPKLLHDRLIVVDGTTAWSLTQSFKDLAVRSPTTIVRTPPDLATAKIEAYADLWKAATSL